MSTSTRILGLSALSESWLTVNEIAAALGLTVKQVSPVIHALKRKGELNVKTTEYVERFSTMPVTTQRQMAAMVWTCPMFLEALEGNSGE